MTHDRKRIAPGRAPSAGADSTSNYRPGRISTPEEIYEALEAFLRLAEIDLEHTVLRSPSDGRVGERQARVGQYVKPGMLLLLTVVAPKVWVVANFKETQIRDMRIGDRVSISGDSAPSVTFKGRVDSLSPASGAQFALLPPDNATDSFTRIVQRIPVKIAIEPGQPGLDRLRPGMSATASASWGA